MFEIYFANKKQMMQKEGFFSDPNPLPSVVLPHTCKPQYDDLV